VTKGSLAQVVELMMELMWSLWSVFYGATCGRSTYCSITT